MAQKSILLILSAKDFNEEEYLTVRNVLYKHGCLIFIASDASGLCTGSSGLKVKADVSFYNANPANFEALIIIGGSGIRNYASNESLRKIVGKFYNSGKILAAICAAPLILANAGILKRAEATCYFEYKSEMEKSGCIYSAKEIVKSGSIITAQNPANAKDFAEFIAAFL